MGCVCVVFVCVCVVWYVYVCGMCVWCDVCMWCVECVYVHLRLGQTSWSAGGIVGWGGVQHSKQVWTGRSGAPLFIISLFYFKNRVYISRADWFSAFQVTLTVFLDNHYITWLKVCEIQNIKGGYFSFHPDLYLGLFLWTAIVTFFFNSLQTYLLYMYFFLKEKYH